jgi:hypothetical protein
MSLTSSPIKPSITGRTLAPRDSRRQALDDLPPVVYAALLRDGRIKIGYSAHLADRLERLGAGTRLLGYRPGGLDSETAIHRHLARYAVPGRREYYRPAREVLRVVNAMREDLGLPPVR